mgnify:FL=1
MLIKALCDYYDCRNEKDLSEIPEGYGMQAVSWQVHLTEKGEISSINDCRDEVEIPQKTKNKDGTITEKPSKIKKVPREIALPERSQKTAVCSNIIEHRPLYIFGLNYTDGKLTPDDSTGKARKSHDDFVRRNLDFFENLNSPVCEAYKKFIENWNPAQQTENPFLLGLGKEYSNSYFCFVLDSDITKSPQTDQEFVEKYHKLLMENKEKSASEDLHTAICPIMGERLPTARIHDKIKFPGGNSSGCVLVGMKESAYESYGKTQSYNSNISEIAMKKYTAAFNSLVNDLHHRVLISDMVVTFFALEHDDTNECDLFSQFFDKAPKIDADRILEEVMVKLKTGTPVDYGSLGMDAAVEFYVAGFTPNSSRICQKFVMKNSFGKIMENMAQHQIDLAIKGNGDRVIRFGSIARELKSPQSAKDSVPPPLMAGIIRAAISGSIYPAELLATVIRRIKTDHNVEGKHFIKMNPTRIGIIKACINRRERRIQDKEEIKMALDVEEKNTAYRCGRLFAVLEKIQQDSAQGKLNTTIVDSYFSAACSRPATVFPKLVELSNHHLRKLEEKSVIFYKRLISDIMSDIGTFFPAALSLEEQGRFILGYYQQNQSLYTANSKEPIKNTEVDRRINYGECN